MNRDEIGTQTCYIDQCTNKCMLMYIACLCPNLVSVHFYAIPILHFIFPKLFIYLLYTYVEGLVINNLGPNELIKINQSDCIKQQMPRTDIHVHKFYSSTTG